LVNQGGGVFEESDLVTTGSATLSATLEAIPAGPSSPEGEYWRGLVQEKLEELEKYDRMYQHYRSQSAGLSEMRFAPFHLLATEGLRGFAGRILGTFRFSIESLRIGNGSSFRRAYELITTNEQESWSKILAWWGRAFLEDRKKAGHKTSSVYSEGTARILRNRH